MCELSTQSQVQPEKQRHSQLTGRPPLSLSEDQWKCGGPLSFGRQGGARAGSSQDASETSNSEPDGRRDNSVQTPAFGEKQVRDPADTGSTSARPVRYEPVSNCGSDLHFPGVPWLTAFTCPVAICTSASPEKCLFRL